jgi:hypothetical protein
VFARGDAAPTPALGAEHQFGTQRGLSSASARRQPPPQADAAGRSAP